MFWNYLKNGSSSLLQELHTTVHARLKLINNLNAYIRIVEESGENSLSVSTERWDRGEARLLEGVPIAVKDNFCTKNIATTCASKMLKNFIPTYNATVVDKLFNAGCVLIGKTNLDEFGMGSGTTESAFGPTKNVWGSEVLHTLHYENFKVLSSASKPSDPDDFFISGGSSGGSAVAVAAGTCMIALGSDTGGSVRNPASYCGVVGFKPSYGSVSRHGLIPLVNSMDVPGILTQCVADCKAAFDVVKGWDPKDPTTLKRKLAPSKLSHQNGLKNMTIGIPKEFHCPGLSAEVVQVWRETTNLLENNGAKIVEVSLPHTKYSIACYSILNSCEVASNMARYDGLRYGHRAGREHATGVDSLYAATRSQALNDIVRGRILAGNYFLLKENYEKYFAKAQKVRRLIYDDYATVWKRGIDLLLTPVTLSDAPLYSQFRQLDPRAQSTQQDFCTQPANMAGIPAISIPIRLSSNGLPLSLQLMAPFYDDLTLLDAAHLVEEAISFPRQSVSVDLHQRAHQSGAS